MSRNQIWLVKNYWKYLLKSKTRYKVHSPFVFDFVEKVLKDKQTSPNLKKIDVYKRKLSKSKTIIETVDFGKGSKHKEFDTYFEKVGELVKKRSQRKKQAHLLHRIAAYFQPQNVLEFGTAAGFSTAYIKSAIPVSHMVSMEGCASLADVANQTLRHLKIEKVDIKVGHFDVLLPKVLKEFDSLDMVFFDGNHRKKPTLKYFEQCLELATENSVFIFDDIHWSPGMDKAWQSIKKDQRVSLTLDLFWFGLVFFRKGMPKQDFILRY
jgi:predicted O-methyltransferase YrrM